MAPVSRLFEPITLGGITLANRIAVSPMCQYSAEDGSANDWHLQHLGSLSLSGAGLLIVEQTAVEPAGRITRGCLGLYSDANEAALARAVALCRRFGSTRLGIQLAHAGRKAPAQLPWRGGGPLHSFLSPIANRRTDRYGGSLANRMRFPLEVAAAVRAVRPRGKALGMRITGFDWVPGGITPEEAGIFAIELRELGFDYVCVSSGGISPKARATVAPGYQVPFAAAVKKASGIATQAVGLIVDAHQAEAIIAQGQADWVALARGFLDDPRWAWHAADALGGEVVCPPQYRRARPDQWPGAAFAHPSRRSGLP